MMIKLNNIFLAITIVLQSSLSLSSQNENEHEGMAITKPKLEPVGTEFPFTTSNKIWGEQCPSGIECALLGDPCIACTFNESCVYGERMTAPCTARVECIGEKKFERELLCRYCYQTEHWEHTCVLKGNCNSVSSPRSHYRTNCTTKSEVLCMGRRTFLKNLPCNWTGGYRWSTALFLSVTLGGFGADRFYLGHWQEGIGKLFSFGGLGVWTLIDVILIAIHYLGPADGSLYI